MSTNEINIYLVRKSALDIASQTGAFFSIDGAIKKAKQTKCNVYNNKKRCIWNYKTEVK